MVSFVERRMMQMKVLLRCSRGLGNAKTVDHGLQQCPFLFFHKPATSLSLLDLGSCLTSTLIHTSRPGLLHVFRFCPGANRMPRPASPLAST